MRCRQGQPGDAADGSGRASGQPPVSRNSCRINRFAKEPRARRSPPRRSATMSAGSAEAPRLDGLSAIGKVVAERHPPMERRALTPLRPARALRSRHPRAPTAARPPASRTDLGPASAALRVALGNRSWIRRCGDHAEVGVSIQGRRDRMWELPSIFQYVSEPHACGHPTPYCPASGTSNTVPRIGLDDCVSCGMVLRIELETTPRT